LATSLSIDFAMPRPSGTDPKRFFVNRIGNRFCDSFLKREVLLVEPVPGIFAGYGTRFLSW
jgi:hypothetical protein